MHYRHHNHHIKIVPFNQADNDQTIPNNLYCFIHVHLPVWMNLVHLGLMKDFFVIWTCFLGIKRMCLIVCINVFVEDSLRWVCLLLSARLVDVSSLSNQKIIKKTCWRPFRWKWRAFQMFVSGGFPHVAKKYT